ncbi:hypothetical protein F5887DRAFT_983681 [Amanita rubescens]|nr:hypothetical protein F5887DRAFT_989795 [Amanita rubescens]KAF8338419.1 hypothetical protein F5887DRAFT_983681 [Amanita rubescens]
MPSIAATRSVNARYKPSYLPVAVITGGTSGIGKHTAQALAKYTKGNAHIILIGRNEAAAKEIIESFPKPSGPDAHPDWKHEFVHCDARLMKNVHAACKSISSRVSRVNFLVLSHGYLNFKGREETEEGIDVKMAIRYYSRWVFTQELLHLLKNAKNAEQKASVLTIMGAGWGPKIDLDDLDLKKKYTGMRCALITLTYNDLMMAEFARKEPRISFTHINPGMVDTPTLRAFHWTLRTFLYFLAWFWPETAENCAEYMLYALIEGREGVSFRNEIADDIGFVRYRGTEESETKLWEHTVQLIRSIRREL